MSSWKFIDRQVIRKVEREREISKLTHGIIVDIDTGVYSPPKAIRQRSRAVSFQTISRCNLSISTETVLSIWVIIGMRHDTLAISGFLTGKHAVCKLQNRLKVILSNPLSMFIAGQVSIDVRAVCAFQVVTRTQAPRTRWSTDGAPLI